MLKRLLLPFGLLLGLAVPILVNGPAFAQKSTAPATCDPSFYQGGRPPVAVSRTAPAGRLICQSFYAISYSTTLRDPLWTSYQLTKAMADGGTATDRFEGNFRQQPGLSAAEQGNHNDYRNQDFVRGHLTPADDAIDMAEQRNTFVVTNIVPQVGLFNSGDWARLEASVHRIAQLEGRVFVVTGVTFPASPARIPTGPGGRIAVPDVMFKAIFVPSLNIAVGYIATNVHPTRCRIVSIAELSRLMGVDPFPALAAAVKATRPDFTLPPGVRRNGAPVQLPNCRAAA